MAMSKAYSRNLATPKFFNSGAGGLVGSKVTSSSDASWLIAGRKTISSSEERVR